MFVRWSRVKTQLHLQTYIHRVLPYHQQYDTVNHPNINATQIHHFVSINIPITCKPTWKRFASSYIWYNRTNHFSNRLISCHNCLLDNSKKKSNQYSTITENLNRTIVPCKPHDLGWSYYNTLWLQNILYPFDTSHHALSPVPALLFWHYLKRAT
jgi:hypothetical protein